MTEKTFRIIELKDLTVLRIRCRKKPCNGVIEIPVEMLGRLDRHNTVCPACRQRLAVSCRAKPRSPRGPRESGWGDGIVDLIEAGVVTNAEKPFDKGVSITGALIGSKKLYDFVHRNPKIGMRSTDYTHGDSTLGALPKLIALNSAVEVDLTVQVNAETRETLSRRDGGQVDYLRAGSRSPVGRPSSLCRRRRRAAGSAKSSRRCPAQ